MGGVFLLRQIKFKNYRCFEESEISFRNTAIIVGQNNAGKSTIVEALRILSVVAQKFKQSNYVEVPRGLGLPLARSLAEMHDGTLELSESMPGFNIFSINLPINHPHSLHLQEEKDEHPVIEIETDVQSYITHKSMPTILIVEDNKEMLHFIAREINVHYNIATSSNGKEAMACLKEYSIQLIISDIVMPVMDGLSLLKAVKNNLEFSHIPVILLTSKNALRSHIE